jgi:hypothetical protein
MPTSKKRNAVVKWSGNNMQYQEVKDTGAPLDVADTWHVLGYIGEAEFADVTSIEKVTNETGKLTRILENDRDVSVKGNLQQSDKDTIDFLTNGCRGKFFRVYRDEGIVDGKHQEYFLGICQFTPQATIKSGTKRPPFEITVIENEAAITIAADKLPTGAHCSAEVTIAAGAYYYISEVA